MLMSNHLFPLPLRLPVAAAALAIWASAGAGCSDDEGFSGVITPLFEAAPKAFVFPKLGIGQSMEQDVQLINRGEGELQVKNLALRDRSSRQEYELFLRTADGELVDVPSRIEIPGDDRERVTLTVRYTPKDESRNDEPDAGAVVFTTNDNDALDVSLSIRSGELLPEIRLNPKAIDFGQIEAGSKAIETVTITNIGQGDLVISRVSINGSQDFHARSGDRALNDDLREDPLVVIPGESLTIEVSYEPPSLGPDTGELLIASNDRRNLNAQGEAVVGVDLRANGAAPCIRLFPESVEFGAALIVEDGDVDTPNRQFLSIESCGTTPLKVSRMWIAGDQTAFRLMEDPEPIELPAATSGVEAPIRLVEIGFWPLEERSYGGELFIESNATAEPIAVSLFGRGVVNACPVPAVTHEIYRVQPLEVITLDGSRSVDPGGRVERWEWTVVSRPDGGVSQPVERYADRREPADGGEPDDPATPTSLFFVDLAGRYEIELRVYDNLGQVSCEPYPVARVTIEALPEKDLHIQLVWTTPEDPDETDDIGTDVDLHLRHQEANGSWNDTANGWDCYFSNKQPDWGVPSDPADNPTLDIDDTNGAGPENINLASPEVGVVYDVAALYFRAESTLGIPDAVSRTERTSLVTIRVFARGQLLAEWIDRELSSVSELWWAASLTWCEDPNRCPEVTEHDIVLAPGEY